MGIYILNLSVLKIRRDMGNSEIELQQFADFILLMISI
jgi:hypothetical protein